VVRIHQFSGSSREQSAPAHFSFGGLVSLLQRAATGDSLRALGFQSSVRCSPKSRRHNRFPSAPFCTAYFAAPVGFILILPAGAAAGSPLLWSSRAARPGVDCSSSSPAVSPSRSRATGPEPSARFPCARFSVRRRPSRCLLPISTAVVILLFVCKDSSSTCFVDSVFPPLTICLVSVLSATPHRHCFCTKVFGHLRLFPTSV
jgi:hypothetical protein